MDIPTRNTENHRIHDKYDNQITKNVLNVTKITGSMCSAKTKRSSFLIKSSQK